ncbi:hypothetical protein B0H17DRAFT_1133340 [Mycena rosella]|uniref:Uncharacterized protein n=1 Tax=Mycena rosella TaxID=1033263 RepID=A0AAD7GKE8_MYCRO|nr:hypothetical protein B0H17DRAFT_1133340 [Mycena rosella]
MDKLHKLLITDRRCDVPDFTTDPWRNAILVTPRHGARVLWNSAAMRRHCTETGHRLYVCSAEDGAGRSEVPLTMEERVLVAGMKARDTNKLTERLELAIGMRAMVLMNISTEGDLENGTRGVVVDIKLDPRESVELEQDPDNGAFILKYPPAVILFKPDHCSFPPFEGLPPGVLPILPSRTTFTITKTSGKTRQITRHQFALTPGYAFTDYKSQGQTLEYVLVDLAKPPGGKLTPFNVGRGTVRLLRDFENELFSTHPSLDLAQEDARMDLLTRSTAETNG